MGTLFGSILFWVAVVVLLVMLFEFISGRWRWRNRPIEHRMNQGSLSVQAQNGAGGQWTGNGIPLCKAGPRIVGVPFGEDRGHTLVLAPTGSGKGLHATHTLLAWPAATITIDPKAELYERTAYTRLQEVGPYYTIPGDSMDLLDYYNLADPLDFDELFEHLMTPHKEREPIFTNKCRFVFKAAYRVGLATRQHPLQLLAAWSEQSPADALGQWLPYARKEIAAFTDSRPLDQLDKFALNAWGTFVTKFSPFAAFVPMFSESRIPKEWAEQRASIYLNFPLAKLKVAAPLIAAALAAFIRGHMTRPGRTPVLLLIDEMPAVGLSNLNDYMATMGGSGITGLLYAQSMPDAARVYGHDQTYALIANCRHRVFYAPNDPDTASFISEELGRETYRQVTISPRGNGSSQLSPFPDPQQETGYSFTEDKRAILEPADVSKLGEADVVCFTRQAGQKLSFVGQRLDGRESFGALPPPPAPVRRTVTTPPTAPPPELEGDAAQLAPSLTASSPRLLPPPPRATMLITEPPADVPLSDVPPASSPSSASPLPPDPPTMPPAGADDAPKPKKKRLF
jgi:hypothetical protein